MGEAFLDSDNNQLIIHSDIILYGSSASISLAQQVAGEIEEMWNEPQALINLNGNLYAIKFSIKGEYQMDITPEEIHDNLNPRINFFRVEPFSNVHISFVDEINCNTGYFLIDNLSNNSTTAAHEYGHTIGLEHPVLLDIRGQGQPGIMYPRGTLVDANYQWDPEVPAGQKGGTLNPAYRKVLTGDIEKLDLHRLSFNENKKSVLGNFTNLFHNAH